ncbi:MAG: dihydrofolate reductase [Caulobacterales bacterium]|nr:dihydrofolate reductase [Caulobacterales bacterium]
MSTPSQAGEPAGPRLALIVARGRNGVIGRAGALPWRLPADMAFFKRATMGKPVVMGRRTWESLPFPLPGRPNLVVSRDLAFAPQGAERFSDLEEMIARARVLARQSGAEEIVVIGGEALYRDTLARADRLYVTEVDAAPEGDARFPDFDEADWREIARSDHPADDRHAHAFAMRTLERRRD